MIISAHYTGCRSAVLFSLRFTSFLPSAFKSYYYSYSVIIKRAPSYFSAPTYCESITVSSSRMLRHWSSLIFSNRHEIFRLPTRDYTADAHVGRTKNSLLRPNSSEFQSQSQFSWNSRIKLLQESDSRELNSDLTRHSVAPSPGFVDLWPHLSFLSFCAKCLKYQCIIVCGPCLDSTSS